ncbi:hypothetical protein GH808_02440 [Acetobacterium fimetarium]|uniref:Uncharacterized protein n=1 Tax=Acetobacterium fimetarium TaxID=52691 RepID=A0ABR6WS08_9FIRM|nr:hypothetical protein [Acetobacterium fimetarium]MBC3803303.1 hypothetical protein [Acetobacterium fimetarium]
MKIKIIKQFFAAFAAVCIIYGSVATTYTSYKNVLAAQAEIPLAIAVKEETTAAAAETDASTATQTPATTTETSGTSTAASTQTESVTAETPTVTKQEELVAVADTTTSAQSQAMAAAVPVVPTLNEFLSQLRCGGCGKNCSLASPRCATGSRKAQQAEAQYDATYS